MKKSALLFLFLILSLTAQSQSATDSIAKRALLVGRSLQQEHVYLQFDNTNYYLGETMWFKAYVTCGSDDRPTTLSKVLYVELAAPEGYIVETKKYKINDDGTCHGEFELKPLFLSGYYEVRAYTRYMLNRGSDAVFSRVFPIYDRVNADNWDFKNMLDRKRGFTHKGKWVTSDLPEADLKFYPEGGHLVDSLPCIVAFELRGNDGIFAEDSITILKDGKAIIKTAPLHDGKGLFTLTPDRKAKYRAEVSMTDKEGKKKKHTFDLPRIEKTGVTLHVEQSSDSTIITIGNNLPDRRDIGFAIIHRGNMGFYKRFTAAEKNKRFAVANNALLEGVSRAVIFTDEIPLAERQFFVTHETLQAGDRGTVKLNVKANNYQLHNLEAKPHEKITVTVEREDKQPIEPTANFALSITDVAGSETTSWSYNMYSYMLLGSELKGYIPDAARYFDPANEQRNEQLNLLMLTHGWTSYDWKKLQTVDVSNIQPVERGITLKGIFYEKRKIQQAGGDDKYSLHPQKENLQRLDISYDNNTIVASTFRTDTTGRFVLQTEDFYGKRIAALTPTRRIKFSDNITYAYSLDRYYSPAFRLYDYWERNTGRPAQKESEESFIKLSPFEYMLSSVEITTERKQERNKRPPHSEMRFDYLDEWEYAQDITFLKNELYDNDGIGELLLDNLELQNMAAEEDPNETLFEPYEGETEEQDNELVAIGKGSENMTVGVKSPIGIYDMYSNSLTASTKKYMGTVRYDGPRLSFGYKAEYENALTAQDVVHSAMLRHNYNWAYWVQLMAVLGEYHSDSVPRPDTDYYKGKDPQKMTNFKEIIIRSDEKTREQFENLEIHWRRKSSALDNKAPAIKYYLGFLSHMYIMNQTGIDGCPDPKIFYDRIADGILQGPNVGRSYPYHPNYVACLIPYTAADSTKGAIIPELHLQQNSRRYTSIQGYSESKEFYSPDYSKQALPEKKDYRRSLLWMPELKSTDGKLSIELYNSSVCSTIDVKIEGRSESNYYSNDATITTRVQNTTRRTNNENTITNSEQQITKFTADSATLAALEYHYERGTIEYNRRKYRQAITIFMELIQYNYPPALRSIGICYLHGHGVTQNLELAAKFLEGAAALDDNVAMYELSLMHRDGIGKIKDPANMLMWLQKAAERNEPRAQTELGKLLIAGEIVEKAPQKGYTLLRTAATNNHPEALYLYGRHMQSDSIDSDEPLGTAHDCIKRSADAGYAEALIYMMLHEDSLQNYKKAYAYAKQLYAIKNHEGTIYMADCYRDGRGVKRNKSIARDFYNEAANAGNEKARERLKEL